MTAINFPDSPSNGDTHVVGGVIYTYDSTETKWKTTINSNAFLPLTGGTLSGNLTLGSNQLTAGGLTYPTSDGTTGQYLQTDGAGALSWATVTDTTGWTWDDTGTTASGTETVITGIPSTARQIIFLFQDISYNGSQDIFLRVGTSSGLVSSGYEVFSGYTDGAGGGAAAERTSAFQAYATGTATNNWNGKFVLTRLSANVWHGTVDITEDGGSSSWHWQRGIVDIGGTLERVGIISTSASTFDAGTVFCHYLEP